MFFGSVSFFFGRPRTTYNPKVSTEPPARYLLFMCLIRKPHTGHDLLFDTRAIILYANLVRRTRFNPGNLTLKIHMVPKLSHFKSIDAITWHLHWGNSFLGCKAAQTSIIFNDWFADDLAPEGLLWTSILWVLRRYSYSFSPQLNFPMFGKENKRCLTKCHACHTRR